MASTYSPNLRLELIGTGEQQGSWGTTTNTNLGTLLEEAIGGYVSVAVTDGADTTLTTSNGSADQSRNMVINLTGALTGARNVICPAIEKVYIVRNATTGGFAVTFKVSGQTGISIPNGATYVLYVDGTDVRQATGSIASGGTGASTAAGAATNLGLGTGDSPQFAAVNIGNATDTTITRSAAGVLAVEGGVIPKENRANTFTANQIISVTDNTNAALRITQLGTGEAFRVEDSTNPDSTPFVINASGSVGLGTDSPSSNLDVRGGNGTGGITGPASGTWAARIVMNQDSSGYSGLSVQNRFANDNTPVFEVAGGFSGSAGYYPVFTVSGSGLCVWKSLAGAEYARVDGNGNVLVTGAGGLGYGTGSGGTVTQGTNRTTGVTLNKTNGAITMFSAAGSTTAATFTVTNSKVAATDTIIVNQKSGTNLYDLMVTAVGTGSFNITFRTTGGTATDAPVINFAVIKAVTS